jgi:hypothetical protein
MMAALVIGSLAANSGCRAVGLRQQSAWSPDHTREPYAQFEPNLVRVHNVRCCKYRTADDYQVNYYDRTYNLDDVESVDFVMAPFTEFSGGAHTFLSFGFRNGEHLAVSPEMRKRLAERRPTMKAICHVNPLIYVMADERDLIQMRTNVRLDDVYVYRLRLSPVESRAMFRDVMVRANQLIQRPEHYNVLTNNCNTNVFRHINHVSSRQVPYSWQVLLPGYSDRLVYKVGLLDTNATFEETKLRSRVNDLAYRYHDDPNFSALIRR